MKEIVIEVQKIAAPERDRFILTTFDSLDAGDSLLLLNDTDPSSFLMHLAEKGSVQHVSEYLANGPVEWKVKVVKKRKEGCCGCC